MAIGLDDLLAKAEAKAVLGGIDLHQSALDQPLSRQWHLWLAGLWAATPGLEQEAIGHRRQCREELIEIAANVVPLGGREPGDHRLLLHRAHDPQLSMSNHER